MAETGLDGHVPLVWEEPTGGGGGGGNGDLFELSQHDGTPTNGFYQQFDFGYGVVYDLSGFSNVTVEMVDFRHSPWGFNGIVGLQDSYC